MGNRCGNCLKRCGDWLGSLAEEGNQKQDQLEKDSDSISIQLKRSFKSSKSKSLELQKSQKQKSQRNNQLMQKAKNSLQNSLINKNNLKQRKQPLLSLSIPENHDFSLNKNESKNIIKYKKVKDRFKPAIDKISTQDEEIVEYYVNNQYFDSDSQDEYETKRSNNKINMTFSHHEESIVIGKEFRTVNPQANVDIQDTIGQVKNIDNIEEKMRLQVQIVKYFLQNKKYEECQQHLASGLLLSQQMKESNRGHQARIKLLKLYGCKRLLQNKINQSIQFLKEAEKLSQKEKISLVDTHYWLGECFLRQFKIKLAKQYLNKSLGEYVAQKTEDEDLLVMLYLQLGNLYFRQQQFAEADKFYSKGIKLSQNSGNSTRYLQLLLKKACNYQQMDNYKKCMIEYSKLFKYLRQNNLTSRPIYLQSQKCYMQTLNKIPEVVISENEFSYIIKIAQELQIGSEGVLKLKIRLKKMRQILYKQ